MQASRIFITLLVVLILLSMATYTVDQREHAIVFRLGEIIAVNEEPGLYFKAPLVDNVKYYDKRILTYETTTPDRFITNEKKNVLVDSFIKWRIIDPGKFYVSVNGDERQAERRLTQTVNDGLRAEFGKRTIQEVVSGERSEIMDIIKERADRESNNIGIEILDVRLRRVDLPKEVSDSVYQRMEAERKSVANELRSKVLQNQKKSKQMQKNKKKLLLPMLIARLRKSRVRVTQRLREYIQTFSIKIKSFMIFIEALKRIEIVLTVKKIF